MAYWWTVAKWATVAAIRYASHALKSFNEAGGSRRAACVLHAQTAGRQRKAQVKLCKAKAKVHATLAACQRERTC